MFKRFLFVAVIAAAPALAQTPTPAADPLPLIDEARTAYSAGELGAARRALESATLSVANKHGEAIRATLPQPFDSWTVTDGETGSVNLAVYGGGVTVDRTYTNSDGTAVRIEVMSDSSMVEQIAAMYGDEAMATMMGMKIETIAGEKAVVDPASDQITIIIDKRTSFAISGSASPEIRRSYAQNINFAAFRALK